MRSKLSFARPWRWFFCERANRSETGQRFLKENASKPGVKTMPSGLPVRCFVRAPARARKTDVVVVNYRGTLISGKEFDSSEKAGRPAEFPLNRVIPGWTEGVQLMKEGAKYEFFIPPNLAYGSRGAGGLIGPDETLIFEVELLKVK
jgi:FKBP-type peptidyl-prolyl cis-trans isomerase